MYMTSAPRVATVAEAMPGLARGLVVVALVVSLLGIFAGGISPAKVMALVSTAPPTVTAMSGTSSL